jgi:hypothetical protein
MSLEQTASIQALDLSMIRLKLMDTDEGPGWTYQQCEAAEIEYRRFLILNKLFSNERIIPTREADLFWHYHILDTRKYHADCQNIFGEYLHHYPYMGMLGKDDEQLLNNLFEKTNQLYIETFQDELSELEMEAAGCARCSRCSRS